jgi:hypothetical protein
MENPKYVNYSVAELFSLKPDRTIDASDSITPPSPDNLTESAKGDKIHFRRYIFPMLALSILLAIAAYKLKQHQKRKDD